MVAIRSQTRGVAHPSKVKVSVVAAVLPFGVGFCLGFSGCSVMFTAVRVRVFVKPRTSDWCRGEMPQAQSNFARFDALNHWISS